MGICKCPKRRVTNQYCFTHRVNVCEFCMMTNHPRCIVQSYIYWLEDSDYNPICEFCTRPLGDEECIRLTCYHLYHWSCAESYYRSLPLTTAPAGYQCKTCSQAVFPPHNLISPVADVLREKLAGVNWARAGLGLPLLSDDKNVKVYIDGTDIAQPDVNYQHSAEDFNPYGAPSERVISVRGTPVGASDDESAPANHKGSPYSVVQMQDERPSFSSVKDNFQGNKNMRRHFDSIDQSKIAVNAFDQDEDKYKRKSAMEWIFRWLKNATAPSRSRRMGVHLYKRYWMAIILLSVTLLLLLFFMVRSARTSAENDPSLQIYNNPNIRFNDIKVDTSK